MTGRTKAAQRDRCQTVFATARPLRRFLLLLPLLATALLYGCSEERSPMVIQPLVDFARAYSPDHTDQVVCDPVTRAPDEVKRILARRIIDDRYRARVVLMALKLYNCQFRHYGQAMELTSGTPFYTAFRAVMGEHSREFVTPADSFSWLKSNPDFMHDPDIHSAVSDTYRLYADRGVDPAGGLPTLRD